MRQDHAKALEKVSQLKAHSAQMQDLLQRQETELDNLQSQNSSLQNQAETLRSDLLAAQTALSQVQADFAKKLIDCQSETSGQAEKLQEVIQNQDRDH